MEKSDDGIAGILEEPQANRQRLGFGSITLLVGLVLFMAVIGWAYVEGSATQPTSGPAPDFTLTTFDGSSFRLSEQRGNVVVLNFWASWCIPCRDEAPILQSLWERYRDQGVVLVGVTYLDLERDSRKFIQEFGITYRTGQTWVQEFRETTAFREFQRRL